MKRYTQPLRVSLAKQHVNARILAQASQRLRDEAQRKANALMLQRRATALPFDRLSVRAWPESPLESVAFDRGMRAGIRVAQRNRFGE